MLFTFKCHHTLVKRQLFHFKAIDNNPESEKAPYQLVRAEILSVQQPLCSS